jgi:hypothetical protein
MKFKDNEPNVPPKLPESKGWGKRSVTGAAAESAGARLETGWDWSFSRVRDALQRQRNAEARKEARLTEAQKRAKRKQELLDEL